MSSIGVSRQMDNTVSQPHYFERKEHRYPAELVLSPPLAQQLDLEHLKTLLQLVPGSKIIDFGSGNGRVAIYFLKQGYDVLSVDVSPKSLAELETLYKRHRGRGWGKLKVATILPAKPMADGIVGADVLHHVDIKATLPKLLNALMPGGRIAFSEPNALHLPWYLHFWLSGIPWQIEKGILSCTPWQLRAAFHEVGFGEVTVTPHGLLPTRFFNRFPKLCRANALTWVDLPFLRYCAFRLLVTARRLLK